MDLNQRKLNKSEWDSIEIPVSKAEQEILSLITKGFSNVQLKVNKTDSKNRKASSRKESERKASHAK